METYALTFFEERNEIMFIAVDTGLFRHCG